MGGCDANQTVNPNGGCTSFSQALSVYNFPNNSWALLDSLASANVNAPLRTRYGGAVLGTDLYYIAGRDNLDNVLNSIDVYSTSSNAWISPALITSQIGLTRSDGCAFVIGSSIFYTGGYSQDYSVVFQSTLVLDTTVALTNGRSYGQFAVGVVADKPYQAGDCGAVAIFGKGYVFGGFGPDFNTPQSHLERYDPATNTWTILSHYITARGDPAYSVIAGNLFIIGGEEKINKTAPNIPNSIYWSVATNNVEHYNILTDTWTTLGPTAVDRFRTSAAAWVRGTRIYNFGGQGTVVITNRSDLINGAYYPVLNSVYHLNVSQYLVNVSADDVGHGVYSGKISSTNVSSSSSTGTVGGPNSGIERMAGGNPGMVAVALSLLAMIVTMK